MNNVEAESAAWILRPMASLTLVGSTVADRTLAPQTGLCMPWPVGPDAAESEAASWRSCSRGVSAESDSPDTELGIMYDTGCTMKESNPFEHGG